MVVSPRHVADVSSGDWIKERLGTFGSVGGLVPLGFDVYLRTKHRFENDAGSIEGLSRETLGALRDVLARNGNVEACFFAIWEGYGWVHGGGISAAAFYSGAPPQPEYEAAVQAASRAPAFPDSVVSGPKLSLPHRNYLLFEGQLSSALELGKRYEILGDERFEPYAPDLIWPADHSWFIATDTDLRFAYVGASDTLAAEISAAEELVSEVVCADGLFAEVEPH